MYLDTAVAMATWFIGTMVRRRDPEDTDEPAEFVNPRPIAGGAGGRRRAGGIPVRPASVGCHRTSVTGPCGSGAGLRDGGVKKKRQGD